MAKPPHFGTQSYSVSRQLELNPHLSRDDKRLPQDTDLLATAPEINGFRVSGPMTESMYNAKGGQWQFVGRKPDEWADWDPNTNPYATGVRSEDVWMFRENAPAPVAAPPRERPDDVPDRQYNIFDYSPKGWDDYTEVARQETLGMNRMPFVGPNGAERGEGYQDIPYDPLLGLEMFYPGTSNQWREKLRDPLDGALLKAIAT
jgi:hypothetical protein